MPAVDGVLAGSRVIRRDEQERRWPGSRARSAAMPAYMYSTGIMSPGSTGGGAAWAGTSTARRRLPRQRHEGLVADGLARRRRSTTTSCPRRRRRPPGASTVTRNWLARSAAWSAKSSVSAAGSSAARTCPLPARAMPVEGGGVGGVLGQGDDVDDHLGALHLGLDLGQRGLGGVGAVREQEHRARTVVAAGGHGLEQAVVQAGRGAELEVVDHGADGVAVGRGLLGDRHLAGEGDQSDLDVGGHLVEERRGRALGRLELVAAHAVADVEREDGRPADALLAGGVVDGLDRRRRAAHPRTWRRASRGRAPRPGPGRTATAPPGATSPSAST